MTMRSLLEQNRRELIAPYLIPIHAFCFLRCNEKSPRFIFACRCPHNDWKQPKGRKHPERMTLHYVLRGSAQYTDWTGKTHRVQTGDTFLLHTAKFKITPDGDDFFQQILTFDETTASHLADIHILDTEKPVAHPGLHISPLHLFDQLLARMMQADDEMPRSAYELSVHIINALAKLGVADQKKHPLIQKALLCIEEFAGRDLTIGEIASSLHMKDNTFSLLFKKEMGVSPKDFIVKRRIEKACKLLLEMNVKETANALGYSDPFQFSKQFKMHTGFSPKNYISMLTSRTGCD